MSNWTRQELDIVETLCRRVRILSADQIRRIWWPHSSRSRSMRRAVQRLTRGCLIVGTIVNVPVCPAGEPLYRWRPGEATPCGWQLSQAARWRWPSAAEPTEVYWASKLAANLFGSSAGRLPPLEHRGHDLHLAEVYALYRTERPRAADSWLGEDALPKAGYRQKDPDAFLVDPDGRISLVVESAGRYSARQVDSFHTHCCQRNLPYELW